MHVGAIARLERFRGWYTGSLLPAVHQPRNRSSPDHRPPATPPAEPAVKRSPSTGSPMRLVEGELTHYTFRKVALTASGPMWECPDTQQRYSTPEQVNAVLAQVHRQWRTHLGIGREALRARRLALGLSAAQADRQAAFPIQRGAAATIHQRQRHGGADRRRSGPPGPQAGSPPPVAAVYGRPGPGNYFQPARYHGYWLRRSRGLGGLIVRNLFTQPSFGTSASATGILDEASVACFASE